MVIVYQKWNVIKNGKNAYIIINANTNQIRKASYYLQQEIKLKKEKVIYAIWKDKSDKIWLIEKAFEELLKQKDLFFKLDTGTKDNE